MESDVVPRRDQIRKAVKDGDGSAATRLREEMVEEFLNSGKYADATISFECLAEADVEALGWKHEETRQAYAELIGFAFLVGCENDESDYTYLDHVLQKAASSLGAGAGLTMAARGYVAHTLMRDGDPTEGVELAEENVEQSRSALGEDDPLSAYYRLELALARFSTQQHGKREKFDADAGEDLGVGARHNAEVDREVRQLRESLGTEHPLALYGRFHLASLQSAAGNHVKALRHFEAISEALEPYREDNAFALSVGIAESRASGRVLGWEPDTLKQFRHTVSVLSGVRGDQDDRTLAARAALGAAYFEADDLYGALEVLTATERDVIDAWGPVEPATLRVRDHVVTCLHHLGRRGQAMDANEEIIADCDRFIGPNSQASRTRQRRRQALLDGYKRPRKRRFGSYPDATGAR